MDQKLLQTAERLMVVVTLGLIAIVAVENWTLYRRVRKLESSLGLRVTSR